MSYLKAVLQNMDEGKISDIYKKEEETDNKKVEIKVVSKDNFVPKKFSKKNFKPKKVSKELEQARQQFLAECMPSKELIEELSLVIGYTKSWQKSIPVDVTEDEIVIKSDKEIKFSKKRFMLSRDFKNLLISEYKKVFNDFYLTIFQSKKDENIFYIKLSQRY